MWGHRFDPRSECCAAAKPERSNSWTSALCSAIRKGTSARSLHTIGSEQPCSLQPKKSPHGNEDPAGPKITNAWVLSHFSSVQSLSCVWLLATPWIAARQASLSLIVSRSSLRLMSIESVMPSSPWCHPAISSSVGSNSVQPYGPLAHQVPCPWDFPGKNTRVGCHVLLPSWPRDWTRIFYV